MSESDYVVRPRNPEWQLLKDLLALAKQYASECGECGGAGIDIEDEDCSECRFIRELIVRAETLYGVQS